jgi:hypothetical protein
MSDRFLVSTRKGLFCVEKLARGWTSRCVGFRGDNVTIATPHAKRWYAALNLGHFGVKLKVTDDGGATWAERAVPEYPPGETYWTWDGKPPQTATLKLIWSLEIDGDRIWAGTGPSALFRSDDDATTWTMCRSLWDQPSRTKWFGGGYDYPGVHSIMVDPRNRDMIRVAISSGGVWRSDDAGATWRATCTGLFAEYAPPENKSDPDSQDPHLVVQCPAMPDHLWMQHHNGIFFSRDGGESWSHADNAKPSVFGFAVAVHPHDGKTAWFVPGEKDQFRVPVNDRLVVSRTRDGGETFELLDRGLPRCDAYDVTYRHALAVDGTGDRLAFGTTTGGLWVSENAGDDWQAIDVRLPPVHAVRWAD